MSEAAKTTANLEGSRMSIMSHLEELRRRLIYVVVMLLLATLACFSLAPQLFELLRQPLATLGEGQLQVLGPLELFITYLKLAVLAGLFVSAPWVLVQLWLFISPGLYRHEKRWIVPFVLLGTGFFFLGGFFAYRIVLPMGFKYLTEMVPESIETTYSVAIYFSLVIRLILAFGVVFQLPLLMWILAAAGVVAPKTFSRFRKFWLVAAVVVAAMLTPPDPFTQMLMAIPLVLFFELGILGAKLLYRRRRRRGA